MKRLSRIRILLTMMATGVIMMTMTAVPAIAAPPLHQASGGGYWVPDADRSNEFVFGFTARQLDAYGNAKGEYEHHNLSKGTILHMEILYMRVDGNQIWVGGVVTKAEGTGAVVGDQRVIRFEDNGEGMNATGPDKRSRMINVGNSAAAALGKPTAGANAVLLPIEAGNIQVR